MTLSSLLVTPDAIETTYGKLSFILRRFSNPRSQVSLFAIRYAA